MATDIDHRLAEMKRAFERQDEQWAEVEEQFSALSCLGIVIKRVVLDDLDDALAAPSRCAHSFQHNIC